MNTKQENGGTTVFVEEDLLSTSVDRLLAEWKNLVEGAENTSAVQVDISKVNIIDSRGLNLLIGFYKECTKRQWPFKVVGSSKDIKRIFSLLKLSERFGIQ